MPLPDERPRQSVANLIGRFEQQKNKSPSSAPQLLPRTSSVASQNTGDSAKEELKEKREWPPKSASADKLSSPPPSAGIKQTIKEPVTTSVSAPEVTSPPLKPAPARQPNVGNAAKHAPTPTPSKPSTTAKSTASKPSAPSSFKSPVKIQSTVKSPTVVSTPLPQAGAPSDSQNSGTSTTSTTTRQPKPSTRGGVPHTPARAKTPSITSTPSRPKTPSSGLYAPTAASLAKARNTPVPTPVKKTSTVVPSSDRLSKPTAASISKARSPIPVTSSPARGAKTPARGTTPAKGTVKPRVGLAPARVKETKENEAGAGAALDGVAADQDDAVEVLEVDEETGHEHEASVSTFASGDVEADPGEGVVEEVEEVHAEEPDHHEHDPQVESHDDSVHDTFGHDSHGAETEVVPEAEEAVPLVEQVESDEANPVEHAGEEHAETNENESEHVELDAPAIEVEVESQDAPSDLYHAEDIIEPEPEPESEAEVVEVATNGTHEPDDIENMVHLLETGVPKPVAGVLSEDVAEEIPDEE